MAVGVDELIEEQPLAASPELKRPSLSSLTGFGRRSSPEGRRSSNGSCANATAGGAKRASWRGDNILNEAPNVNQVLDVFGMRDYRQMAEVRQT